MADLPLTLHKPVQAGVTDDFPSGWAPAELEVHLQRWHGARDPKVKVTINGQTAVLKVTVCEARVLADLLNKVADRADLGECAGFYERPDGLKVQ